MTRMMRDALVHAAVRGVLVSVGVLVIGTLWLWLSDQAFQDELVEFERTCDMIDAGHWPAEVEPACAGREENDGP